MARATSREIRRKRSAHLGRHPSAECPRDRAFFHGEFAVLRSRTQYDHSAGKPLHGLGYASRVTPATFNPSIALFFPNLGAGRWRVIKIPLTLAFLTEVWYNDEE